jgi:hypothetical protein
VVDELLADTRGYPSKEWDRFIYVIYETVRLKPETEWRQMLKENGVEGSTELIVISGEPAETKKILKPGKRRAVDKNVAAHASQIHE